MWTSKLFWKLFFIYTGLSLGLAVVFLWTVAGLFDRFAGEYVAADLEQTGATLLASLPASAADPVPLLVEKVKQHAWQREHQALVLDPQGQPLHGELLSGPAALSVADRQALQRGETLRWGGRTRKGEVALFVALPLSVSERLVAILLLAVPSPKLDPHLATVRQTLWPLVFLLTLASVVVMFWVLTQTSRRLTQLTLGAQAIAETDDPQLIPLESLDELGLLGAALNKMQQKLARRMHELRENSERLETMLGSMVEGVLAVSPELDVLLANNASCKLLGITIDQPLGRPLLDVTRSLPLHAAVVEAIQSNLPVTREFESNSFPRKTLTVRAMNMPGTPSPGVMVVLHDMTELRRLENLRREFVANVSHELKTPLSVIKAYAETLKMGAINDPEHSLDFVNRTEEQAERLYELILDLLQLARIESGQEVFDIVDVDLSEAVLDCVEQYADLAASKRIRLVPEGPEDPVVVRGDEEGVRTILSNLINNAVKYTPEEGSVTVRWRHEEGLGVLEVEDTGIGIAPRDQARIFERFYRVDRARSRELGGTGLGLSIVKQLTQAFGGTAGVESKAQKGSLFWVRLPCEKSQTTSLHAVVSS